MVKSARRASSTAEKAASLEFLDLGLVAISCLAPETQYAPSAATGGARVSPSGRAGRV
jgi:hypothetical protein